MKLCTFLKSRLDSVRRVTRETLQTIMTSIGANYLPTMISEMKALLTRGFHVHVMVYSIHSVLVALKPIFKEGDIDKCVHSLINVSWIFFYFIYDLLLGATDFQNKNNPNQGGDIRSKFLTLIWSSLNVAKPNKKLSSIFFNLIINQKLY
jgi:hypothetical protein